MALLPFTAALSKKGFMKLKLSFEARNERDAALLRRPLVYYAQCFAADASASAQVPPWVKDLTSHLRVVVTGRRMVVVAMIFSHCDRCLVVERDSDGCIPYGGMV